ncbi:MAG: GatB/YqeY domain-containing protein [Bacilli bacterium]|nr:GatB/YqeY domain-containing protein [Bacilli bacterium]MDD4053687.1 GatB/YqeY domain-containing protein [Bacilli bacterium]MDD4411186.1 GatB/YqeY domain-containing protein [Bacilli bacterium]
MLEKLTQDMIDAMKAKDKEKLSVIRMVKGVVQLEEINKKQKLEDDDIIAIISKQIKMRKESIEEFKKGNRDDLVVQTESEVEILNKYMPTQLTEEKLETIIDEIIVKVEAKEVSDVGKIMKELVPLIKGKADMGKVNLLIKQKLSI